MNIANPSYVAAGSVTRAGGKQQSGKRKVCRFFDDVTYPDTSKPAGDALPEIILTSTVAADSLLGFDHHLHYEDYLRHIHVSELP